MILCFVIHVISLRTLLYLMKYVELYDFGI